MALNPITTEDFENTLAQNSKVFVKFTADWCAPCKAFNPTLLKAAEAHPDILFVEVDVQKDPGLAQKFHVRNIPAVFGFQDGNVAFQFIGVLQPAQLEQQLANFK